MRYAIFLTLALAGCAGVQQGDARQVSIVHMPRDSYANIYAQASRHCGEYGKNAVPQGRFSAQETLFLCR